MKSETPAARRARRSTPTLAEPAPFARLRPWLVPCGLVLVWLTLPLLPPVLGPTTSVAAATAIGAALCAVAVWRGSLDRDGVRLALVGLAPILVLLLAAVTRANDTVVSVFGGATLPAGWLTWFAAWVWFVAALALSGGGAVGRLSRTLAWLGGAAAAAALLDRVGLVPNAFRWSDLPSGFFDNPNTLAQGLVLGLGGAMAWALGARTARGRALGWSLAAIIAVNLLGTDSRGTYAGVVIAALAAWGLGAWGPRATRSSAAKREESQIAGRAGVWAGWTVAAGALIVTGATAALAYGAFGPKVTSAADTLLSGRVTSWHAALVQFSRTPILGEGPGMFSAWYAWQPDPTRLFGVSTTGTYDAHSVLLSWLAAAGLAGLLMAITASAILAGALVRVAALSRWSRPLLALLAGFAAWSISLVVEWPVPVALMTAAVMAGTVLGSTSRRDGAAPAAAGPSPGGPHEPTPARVARALLATTAVVAMGLFVANAPRVATEIHWGTAKTVTPELLAESFSRSHDGFYAVQELQGRLVEASSEATSDVVLARLSEPANQLGRTARWNVYAARLRVQAEAYLTANEAPAEQWAAISTALDDGRQGDPSSSIWDWLGAREAARLGMTAEAARLTARARQLGLPPDAQGPP